MSSNALLKHIFWRAFIQLYDSMCYSNNVTYVGIRYLLSPKKYTLTYVSMCCFIGFVLAFFSSSDTYNVDSKEEKKKLSMFPWVCVCACVFVHALGKTWKKSIT